MAGSLEKYDFVVFGATGFTGQYVVEEVARVAELDKKKNPGAEPLTWAVAGRNVDKLKSALQTAKDITGLSMDHAGIIQADVTNEASIKQMAEQAKVVINTVGPYTQFGEPVVKACVAAGTSHVDITGEPQFMEKMQLQYHDAARESGSYVVSACGYDSIPADVGTAHMLEKFPGDLNSVEAYVRFKSTASIHTGTMESAALFISSTDELSKIRSKLFPTKLPKPEVSIPNRGSVHYNDDLNCWAMRFASDESSVYRSQRYRHDTLGLRPVQYRGYMITPGRFKSYMMMLGMGFFALLCYFSITRRLLFKYPEALTGGIFTREGPSREALQRAKFWMKLKGCGWSEKLAEGSDKHTTKPDTKATVTIEGPDAGYAATSLMLVASAMTLLREKGNCPSTGGVFAPGAAFSKTGIVQRLLDRGMTVQYTFDEPAPVKSKM